MASPASRIEVCDGQQMAQIIDEMWDDRVSFAKYIIGFNPSDQQAGALLALDQHDSVTVKSGHGCGKSGVRPVAGEEKTVRRRLDARPKALHAG